MFKVMIQEAARTIFDDPITGEYDGIYYSTKEEAQKVSVEALEKYPALEWSWVEEVKDINGRNYKIDRIRLHEVTMAEKDEIYDKLIDLICDNCVDFDIIPGMFNDTFDLRIIMKDIEKFSISIDHDSITTLEIVTRDYIFMHDVTTATGVSLA